MLCYVEFKKKEKYNNIPKLAYIHQHTTHNIEIIVKYVKNDEKEKEKEEKH